MAARLLFGLPAQLAGQALEPVQGGIDADYMIRLDVSSD